MIGKYFLALDDVELEPVRKDLLQLGLTTACFLGGAALGVYIIIANQQDSLPDLIPHALAFFLLIFITLNKQLAYRSRVAVTMFCVYSLGLSEFINNGLHGDGRILMLTFVALTSYFSGIRWGFLALLLSIATQVVLGIAIPQHWIAGPVLNDLDVNTSTLAWHVSTFMFVILASVMVGGGYLIISHLARSLARQRSLMGELNQERDSLKRRVDEQTSDLRKEIAIRVRMEAELRASESQFRMLFELSLIPIVVLRREKISLVNPAYLRLVGAQNAAEITGHSYLDLALPAEQSKLLEISTAFEAGKILADTYETVGLRLDGTTFPCEVSINHLPLPGEPATLIYLMDITDRKLSAERLTYLGTHDPLTGLYNRAYFEQMLDGDLQVEAMPVSVLMLDLNGLKAVNDTCGHAAGDSLLADSASVLMRVMRGEDTVARIGGDEFVVIMPATDEASAGRVVSRIRFAIQAHNHGPAARRPISIAIGSATLLDGEPLVEVVKRADEAMYIDKREKAL